jgi:hypothetical protein
MGTSRRRPRGLLSGTGTVFPRYPTLRFTAEGADRFAEALRFSLADTDPPDRVIVTENAIPMVNPLRFRPRMLKSTGALDASAAQTPLDVPKGSDRLTPAARMVAVTKRLQMAKTAIPVFRPR